MTFCDLLFWARLLGVSDRLVALCAGGDEMKLARFVGDALADPVAVARASQRIEALLWELPDLGEVT